MGRYHPPLTVEGTVIETYYVVSNTTYLFIIVVSGSYINDFLMHNCVYVG